MMGGATFHAAIAGMLFRPPQFYLARYLMRQKRRCEIPVAEETTRPGHVAVITNNVSTTPSDCERDDTVLECNANISNDITIDNLQSKISFSQWDILKNPLLYIYVLSFSVADSTFHNAFIMLPPHASEIGIVDFRAVVLLSVMGISGTVSRFLTGWMADYNLVKKKHAYLVSVAVFGLVFCVFPLVNQFTHLAVLCALCGLLVGSIVVLAPVLLADEFGLVYISLTYGIMYRFVIIISIA